MKSKTCATGIVTCSCSLKEYLTLCRSPMSPCLNDQIEYYHGIGDLNEEFVEKLHQETKKFRKRMGHLSDYQKQINAMVVLNRLENLDKVKEAQEKVVVRLGSTDGFGSAVPTNHQRHISDHVGNTASSNEGTTQ
eukprot:CAMPEP_0196802586 /NCGR_PEP_ID=MMETSP1362-20130617/2173_1 /TAXON_ID=163516 /ORGANISM="Leptocylindrus danicus, Strain CCMP1856" /LENGTH=134 /DNA_ID=CAMNT_0042173921 /DNA_START=1430 /DNA_END=1834 /DNA_ORIENTATION=-